MQESAEIFFWRRPEGPFLRFHNNYDPHFLTLNNRVTGFLNSATGCFATASKTLIFKIDPIFRLCQALNSIL
jgi:hypothetical protein